MPPIILSVPLILMSGIAYRIRGSEFYANGFGSRALKLAIGGLPRGLAFLFFAPWYYALIVWVFSALADSWGHAGGQSFGSPGDDEMGQALVMAEAGFISALPTALALAALDIQLDRLSLIVPMLAAAAAGVAVPLAYWIGWHLPSIGVQGSPWWRRLLTGTEWAEFITGLLLCLYLLA